MTRPGRGRRSPECAGRAFLSSQTKRPGRARPARLMRNPVKAPSFDRLSRAFARTSPHLRCAGARPTGYISDAGDAPGDAKTEAKRGGSKACQKGRKRSQKGGKRVGNSCEFVFICSYLSNFAEIPARLPPAGRKPSAETPPPREFSCGSRRGGSQKEARAPQRGGATAASRVGGKPDSRPRQNHRLSRRGAFFPPFFSDANAPENGRFPNRPYEKTTTGDCPRHQWETMDGTQECVPYGAGFPGGEQPLLLVASETKCRASSVSFSNKSYN